MGDDHHRLRLRFGGRKGLPAVRAAAGPLCDIGGRDSVALELRLHVFDASLQHPSPPLRVSRDLRALGANSLVLGTVFDIASEAAIKRVVDEFAGRPTDPTP